MVPDSIGGLCYRMKGNRVSCENSRTGFVEFVSEAKIKKKKRKEKKKKKKKKK